MPIHAAIVAVLSIWKHENIEAGIWSREKLHPQLQHAKTLVADDAIYAIWITVAELLEETDVAGLVLFGAFDSTENLMVSILIDHNCHQNGCIFKLPHASYGADKSRSHRHTDNSHLAEAGCANFQCGHSFLLRSLMVGGHFAVPQRFCNVLYTPDRHASKAWFNQEYRHMDLPAVIPFDNRSFKGDSLEFANFESDISGAVSGLTEQQVAGKIEERYVIG